MSVPTKRPAKVRANGAAPKPKRLRRTIRIECDWVEPVEGEEKLWADIASLSFDEIDAVKATLDSLGDLRVIGEFISPYVIRWNALDADLNPIPPPAEIGQSALQKQEPWVTTWMSLKLGTVNIFPSFLSTASPPVDTPNGDGDASST